MKQKFALTTLLFFVGAIGLSSVSADAADRDFCRDYAQTALRQVHDALSVPACRVGLKGDRWSSDYRIHFNWCLHAAVPKIESERAAREGYLYGCGAFRPYR